MTAPTLQTKLKIGAPNDKFEQEANRVAERIMRMPEPQALEEAAIPGSPSSHLQRVCQECEQESGRPPAVQRMCAECEEEETVRTKEVTGGTPEVTPHVQGQINALRGARSKRAAAVSPALLRKRKVALGQLPINYPSGFGRRAPLLNAASLPAAPALQTKLRIGERNDKFEQEADPVAAEVMRMPEPQTREGAAVCGSTTLGRIQRVCAECQERLSSRPVAIQRMCLHCEAELQRQPARKTSGRTPEVSPDVQAEINGLRGSGQPLPESGRAFFEPRFGYDFSGVRVHTNSGAALVASKVNARAFTVGQDVVFGAGEYAPSTAAGRQMLAHELTHVVQQQGMSSLPLQRLTEAEKAEDLKSPKYAGNPRLEKAFDNDPPLSIGESREAVRLIQEGLVADGFAMPRSTKPTGELDGAFGGETFGVVKQFQIKHGLDVDGIVGRQTMGKLDELALTAPCVFPVGVFNGPHHEPIDTDTHAGMLIDINILPSTGRPADLQGVEVEEQVTPSFDHTGSLADHPPIISKTAPPLPAASHRRDGQQLQKAFIIDRAINHGGSGNLSVHQLDVFKHPACGVTTPRVVPASGHRIDMIITKGTGGRVELTVRKKAEACTVNGFTAGAGPSLTHSDTVLVRPAGAITTRFTAQGSPRAVSPRTVFRDGDKIDTKALRRQFDWLAAVTVQGSSSDCFEVGFLQTVAENFIFATYFPTDAAGIPVPGLCGVIQPRMPIRDGDTTERVWYRAKGFKEVGEEIEPTKVSFSLLGTCQPLPEDFPLPSSISPIVQISSTGVTMDDNPGGLFDIEFPSVPRKRLRRIVERLEFHTWLAVRPRQAPQDDLASYQFLKNATWVVRRNIRFTHSPSGEIGFSFEQNETSITAFGDGKGASDPDLSPQTANEEQEKICIP